MTGDEHQPWIPETAMNVFGALCLILHILISKKSILPWSDWDNFLDSDSVLMSLKW